MDQHAENILRRHFGFDSFRGQQQEIIESAIRGEDCLVLMPTGGGKSICYQIAALVRPGMGIVVSPLIALMQDQVTALQQMGIRAEFLNSTLDADQSRDIAQRISAGAVDILYIAPERLVLEGTLQWLGSFEISLIAIDEAHCVSQWGHDFRRDYMALEKLGKQFPGVPRMALTATATPESRLDIARNLGLVEAREFISSFDRPNIRYSVTARHDAKAQLLRFLDDYQGASGIVYCLSRKKVDATAQWLAGKGYIALPYHAGMADRERTANQSRFLNEDNVIIVATIAFGMGIDKPDVRFVAHLDLPGSVEAYYQETGRAGRDGLPAQAWMVYGLGDVVQRSQMVDQSDGEDTFRRNQKSKLNDLLGWCETTACRRQLLLAYFGEELPEPCGNCDTCLNPPLTWDGTEAAQKLLSCIYRTGQKFGSGHVIDVLLGKDTDKVVQHGHRGLTTFGIGSELSANQWRSVIRQLIVQEYLVTNAEKYGALQLTGASRPLLRGEIKLHLRKEVATGKPRRKSDSTTGISDRDLPRWEALRDCRKKLADEYGIPPYMVFHDSTLMEILQQMPKQESELLQISGVGDAKLARFGAEFLRVVQEFEDNTSPAAG